MENNKDFELTEEEQEFLHRMYEETFDFNKWCDDMDEAFNNAEFEEILKSIKPAEDFELELKVKAPADRWGLILFRYLIFNFFKYNSVTTY